MKGAACVFVAACIPRYREIITIKSPDEYKAKSCISRPALLRRRGKVSCLCMLLEYQPRVLPHFVKPDGSPAFLRNAQFRCKGSQERGSVDSVVGNPVGVRVNETF